MIPLTGTKRVKASKFPEVRIAFVLKQAEDGSAVAKGLPQGQDQAISEATFYNWGEKHAVLLTSEMRRIPGRPVLSQPIRQAASFWIDDHDR
jgi:hypothetical protein